MGSGNGVTEIDKPAPSSLSALPRRLAWQLAARAELLVVAGVTLLVLATATALSLSAAVVAWALISAYALAVPARRPEATGRLARSGSTSADLADRARQAVLDAMPEPSWLVDDGGKVRGSNAAALALFPRLRTGAANASAVRNPEIIDTIEAVRRDGVMRTAILHLRVPVERRLSVVVAPVPSSGDAVADPDLPPALLLLTSRDLTEQDRLSQMRADFVANASHELRTPLASLRGFVETLQGPARNDAGARERFLAIMAQQAERMTRLIDDLLSLSRVEMRAARGADAPSSIMTEVATHVMQALEPQAARANIVLRCEVESRPLMVRGDRDELVAGGAEPGPERHQVRHEATAASRLRFVACPRRQRAAGSGGTRGHRRRSRHPRRAHSAADRAVLPGRACRRAATRAAPGSGSRSSSTSSAAMVANCRICLPARPGIDVRGPDRSAGSSVTAKLK